MSNRRRLATNRKPKPIPSLLDALVGHRLLGGCDDCNAYQDVTRVDGIYTINVRHDATCPWYNARVGRR